MIDFGKVLKRAWFILWNYRILWIFGILLAITGGAANRGNNGSTGIRYTFGGQDFRNFHPGAWWDEFTRWFTLNVEPLLNHPEQHVGAWIAIGVGILLFILLGIAITSLVRYVTETAVLRMVDEHESTGQKVGFAQGWRLGWSRRAFRLWVIDLILSIPVIVFVAILVGLGFAVFFSVESRSQFTNVAGTVASVGFAFLVLFVFILGMVFLGLLRQFFIRKTALEGTRIGESLRFGWLMFKQNWNSGLLMWLIMLGIGIGATIAGFIVFFLLIPVYIIMAIPGLLVAAVPGLIAVGITSLFASGPLAWIIGGVVALPIFFTIVFLPLSLIGGWYKIFESSAWTVAYREMKALEMVKPEPATGETE